MPDSPTPRDRFLHIADIHFWHLEWNPALLLNKRLLGNANVYFRRRKHFHQQHAEAHANHAASLGIRDVLLTGDFTSTASPREFARTRDFIAGLQRRGLDPRSMPGNHDVYTFESLRKRRYEQYLGDDRPRHGTPTPRPLPGGTPVVMVDTVCPNLVSSRGLFAPESEAPLRALLAELPEPIVVAAHYPVLPETYAYRVTRNRALRRAENLRRILLESGKHILYIHGHEHRSSFVRDPVHARVLYLSTDCLFRHDAHRKTAGEFAEVEVHNDALIVYRHRYWGHWVRERLEPR